MYCGPPSIVEGQGESYYCSRHLHLHPSRPTFLHPQYQNQLLLPIPSTPPSTPKPQELSARKFREPSSLLTVNPSDDTGPTYLTHLEGSHFHTFAGYASFYAPSQDITRQLAYTAPGSTSLSSSKVSKHHPILDGPSGLHQIRKSQGDDSPAITSNQGPRSTNKCTRIRISISQVNNPATMARLDNLRPKRETGASRPRKLVRPPIKMSEK